MAPHASTLTAASEATLRSVALAAWKSGRPLSVSFVCTGNICRSPTGDGVLRVLARKAALTPFLTVSSSGTSGHVGWAPDPRTVRTAKAHGYDLSPQRARRLGSSDFDDCDLLLALDSGHYEDIVAHRRRLGAASRRATVHYMTAFAAGHHPRDVVDPYYEDTEAFEYVFCLVEEVCANIVGALSTQLGELRAAAGVTGRSIRDPEEAAAVLTTAEG